MVNAPLLAVGWSAPLAPADGAWDWWAGFGVVTAGVALWRGTRLPGSVILVVALIAGAVIGDLTHTFGIAPIWGPASLLVTVLTLRIRRFG